MGEESKRVFGLDIFRAVAISFVLLAHTLPGVLAAEYNSLILICGVIGVELFFVLSGFLIGGIIIRNFLENQKYKMKNIGIFWIRRWFRTLPNYYLVLILFTIYFSLFIMPLTFAHIKFLQPFAIFMQNFMSPQIPFFDVSWSLAIEEWFYILFPLSLFFIAKFYKDKKKALLITIFTVIIFSNIIRIYFALQPFQPEDWDIIFRKIVLFRLDSIAFGVLIAYYGAFHKESWEKNKNLFLTCGILMVLVLLYTLFEFFQAKAPESFFMRTFFFSILSLGMALLIPYLTTVKKTRFEGINKFIITTSLISYSIYLIHQIIIGIVYKFDTRQSIERMLFIWILIFAISFVQYKYYEKPLTNLRERFKNE